MRASPHQKKRIQYIKNHLLIDVNSEEERKKIFGER